MSSPSIVQHFMPTTPTFRNGMHRQRSLRRLIVEQLEDRCLMAVIDLATLTSGQGTIIFGAEANNDYSGRSVSGAGDVNGDGFDDLLIGAFGGDALNNTKLNAGESYVIFGGAALPATIDLANLGTAGITIFGVDAGDRSGYSVSGAGDINGDGFDDLIVGARLAKAGNVRNYAGESYVIFGGAALPSTIDLANLSTAGITLLGAEVGDRSGYSVSGAGDVNGDGFDDLIIGAATADAAGNAKLSAGESYVIFGGTTLPMTIDLANPIAVGITILGADADDESGRSVSGVGDVNGDGFDDLIIGAGSADAAGETKLSAGESYLIFGGAALPATIDVANLVAAGITIFGAEAGDQSGSSVSGAGDVNGDGFDDLLVGAPLADANNNSKSSAGESYVIFGGATLPAIIDLANLGAAGNRILGADSDDRNGRSVSGAGDINGDGFDDLILGAYRAHAAGNLKPTAGESYAIFGADFLGSVTHMGTVAAETLTGTSGANVMVGGRNNDTLLGNGGADVLTGGQGDDELVVSDLAFKRIVGGTGSDVLRLIGAGLSLDLTTLRDNRILGIETIDITGSGNNTLSLNQREVLNISDESNTLVVRRNAGDIVNIGTGWTQVANETIGPHVFVVFSQGQATLKVQVAGSAVVANRQVFYNRSTSSVFGNGSGNPTAAIDATKVALLPGQTTSYANYTNYSRGLNGIVIDVANVGGLITAADFQFATWNGVNSAGFIATAAVPTITVIPNGGVGNTTRVKIEFADNAVRNAWLRVTMLANANTSLAANDVFYFGNAVGDVNVGNTGTPVIVQTNDSDTMAVRKNGSPAANSVPVSNIFDLNKDGRVNAIDVSLAIQNRSTSGLRYFNAPINLRLAIKPTSIPRFSTLNAIPATASVGASKNNVSSSLKCVDTFFAAFEFPNL